MKREWIGFKTPTLDPEAAAWLEKLARYCRRDVVELIDRTGSGHIGGSFSCMEMLAVLYGCSTLAPNNALFFDRDKIIVSNAHISAAVYAVLANLGFLSREQVFAEYRRVPGLVEGHPGRNVPGVDWGSGALGQGLSVACGMALAARLRGDDSAVFVLMGDGEQQEGQITEAAEFAAHHKLANIVALVDCNGLQCNGGTGEILGQDLRMKYEAAGWHVVDADGHDVAGLYAAVRSCLGLPRPGVVLARTVMGKGLPFIENNCAYHGGLLTAEQTEQARALLTLDNWQPTPKPDVPARDRTAQQCKPASIPVYPAGQSVACRSVIGPVLSACARASGEPARPVVLDCDVGGSTGSIAYGKDFPDRFIQCGIQEANAASVAGAVAASGLPAVFASFAVFSLDQPYSQLRMNRLNHVNEKIIATHCGLDVGEDGKTHQCIDYIAQAVNLLDAELLIPADANQAAAMLAYLLASPRPGIFATGRSKKPIIADGDGRALFGDGYRFEYGKADWLRPPGAATVVTCGNMVEYALEATDELARHGTPVGVLNLCCPKALDREALRVAAECGAVVTYEDHYHCTGLASLVAQHYMKEGVSCRFETLGVKRPGGSAGAMLLYEMQGLDPASLAGVLKRMTEAKR